MHYFASCPGSPKLSLSTNAQERTLTPRKYLVLLAVVVFGSLGDTLLARGMKDVGAIDIHHVAHVFFALANPWVIIGILCLLGFMSSYMTALSFADLTYVLPATAIGYVVMALLSRFWLHEHISIERWAGIALITIGVGLVAGGPSRTEHPPAPTADSKAIQERV
jgi:drug/metabolite transporter (DMT)-like permease